MQLGIQPQTRAPQTVVSRKMTLLDSMLICRQGNRDRTVCCLLCSAHQLFRKIQNHRLRIGVLLLKQRFPIFLLYTSPHQTTHHDLSGTEKSVIHKNKTKQNLYSAFVEPFGDAFAATRFTFAGMCFVVVTFAELSRATQKLQTCTFATLSRRARLQSLSPQALRAFAPCILAFAGLR